MSPALDKTDSASGSGLERFVQQNLLGGADTLLRVVENLP